MPRTARTRLSPCAIGLLVLLASPGRVASATATPEEARQRLGEVAARIEKIQSKLAEHRRKASGQTAKLAETEKRAGQLRRELARLDREAAAQEARLADLRTRHRETAKTVEHQRALLLDQLRSAWLLGRQAPVKLLLNQTDPSALGRVLVYYRYLNGARTERLQAWEESRARLAELQQEVERTLKQLATLRDEKRNGLDRLHAELDRRKRLLARLRKTIRDEDARLRRLQKDRGRLERLLRSLREALADVRQVDRRNRPLRKLRGKLPWPTQGRIRHRYGEPRLGNRSHWRGILIAAPEGREVRAIHHGQVVFADWLRGFGLLLIIDHGDGFLSLYGRNASLYRDVGEWVESGEVVATVGDTGNGGESGLYFELRHRGQPLDPIGWLDNRKAGRLARQTGGR